MIGKADNLDFSDFAAIDLAALSAEWTCPVTRCFDFEGAALNPKSRR